MENRNRLYGRLASQYALDELCRAKQWHQTKQKYQSRGCCQSMSDRNWVRIVRRKPNFLSCLRKWRRAWHLFTIEEQLLTHNRILVMVKPKSLKESVD